MRIASFDVFDTLLTRTFAVPRDLFLALGERLHAENVSNLKSGEWAQMRVEAELQARAKTDHHEVNLDEIYRELALELGWDESAAGRARSMELELEESSTRSIGRMVEAVSKARGETDCVLFISEMYLPAEFIVARLKQFGFFEDGDELFLSCVSRRSKSSGGLYEEVRKKYPQIDSWKHVGDHPYSDLSVPRKLGIEASLRDRGRLTRFETAARGDDAETTIWRSRLAAAMRMARLERPKLDRRDAYLWRVVTQAPAPILFGFVYWCLRQAIDRKIGRLYFVSRDGQILHRIATMMVEKWKLGVECRYLFGSRQAWHAAAVKQLESRDLGWILAPTAYLSVERVFQRVGVSPERCLTALEAADFPKVRWRENLDEAARARLGKVVLEDPVRSVLQEESAKKREVVLHYLRQEGLMDPDPWAIVDIGWHGNLQASLTRLVEEGEREGGRPRGHPVCGFYFGLAVPQVDSPTQVSVAYWNPPGSPKHVLSLLNWALIEIFTAADHGPVTGYGRGDDGRIVPVFLHEKNQEALDWGLAVQHEAILKFTSSLLEIMPKGGPKPEDLREVTRQFYDLFYFKPSTFAAAVWGEFPFGDDQVATSTRLFLPSMSWEEMVKAVIRRNRRPAFWWMEGALALKPCLPLWLYANLRRLKLKLCN